MIDFLAYTDGFNQNWMIPLWILKEPVLMEPHEFIRIIGTIDGYYCLNQYLFVLSFIS